MNQIKDYLKQLGKLGGKAGKGKSKVRGDSEYYRRIAKKRNKKASENQ